MVARRIMLAWLLVVGGSPVCAQTAADPRALIGEWSGLATQISPRGAGSRGAYTLAIERVEGAKVYCLARSLNCVALASKPGMRCSVTNVQ